jgi:hypothetical protein
MHKEDLKIIIQAGLLGSGTSVQVVVAKKG